MNKNIKLKHPYSGTGEVDGNIICLAQNVFIPYDKYLYDVEEGRVHSLEEYQEYKKPQPKTLINYQRNYFFGLFKVDIVVLDTKNKDTSLKYFHSIDFSFLMHKYNIQIYSSISGLFDLDCKH